MSLNTKIKIQIPKSGVVIRKNGKYKYAYKAVDFFRNKKGQPDNKRRCIGKIDVETGLLIPNEIYFELYSENTVSVV